MTFTYEQFNNRFPNEDACLDRIFQLRYGNIKICPHCTKHTKFYRVKKRKCYECQYCGFQVYPLVGTIMQKSTTPLSKWFHAAYLMTASRNGVSAKELERHLGITYKCAWRIGHQIRKLMAVASNTNKFSFDVQADETYIGGYKRGGGTGRGSSNKTPVFGITDETGKVHAIKVTDVKRNTLYPLILKYVKKGSKITTDELPTYATLKKLGFKHKVVKHAIKEYVNKYGDTTNRIEGFWSILKRSLTGTHIQISPKHLQKYLDEFEFRYNHRNGKTTMFDAVLNAIKKKN